MQIGIIGVGYWGPNIVRNILKHPHFKLKYICDLDEIRLKKITTNHPNIITKTDYHEILCDRDLEAVIIVTPPETHYSIGKDVLNAKKHLLLEKPITKTTKEADELIKLAEKNNVSLMCDLTYCYHPCVEFIKNQMETDDLGKLLYLDSVRINLGLFQSNTNVIWDLGPHDLSIILYLIGDKITSVTASAFDVTKTGHESVSYITLHLENAVCHIHLNWLSPIKVRKLIVGCSKKMIVWDDVQSDEKIKIYNKGIDINDNEKEKLLITYRNGDISIPKLPDTEALYNMIDEFYLSIKNKRPSRTDGKFARHVLYLIEKIHESVKNCQTVKV